ncbi:MAG: hypothetical protein IPO63_04425 [Bacteroidetes bacterium]|nr:hypothetical protein [Bacteroidota bacterium]
MKKFTLILLSAVVLGSLSSAVAQTFTLSNVVPVLVLIHGHLLNHM